MVASAALLLGVIHALRWAFDRRSRADLSFAVVALAFVGVAITELGSMYAASAKEWGSWIRWCHVPLFFLNVGVLVFIHDYLGTGRAWLGWTTVAVRTGILLFNFGSAPNFNFASVDSIRQIGFLGEPVSVIGEAVTNPWQVVATLSAVLLLAYVLDAAVASWRIGNREARRKAVTIGGSIFVFSLLAVFYTQFVIWLHVELPFLITPSFLVPLCAMSIELSRDMLRASRLTGELNETERRLELAASAADLGLCAWDGRTGRFWATERARDIFGLTDGDSVSVDSWVARLHPDDAPRLQREFEQSFAGKREFAAEFRVLPPGSGTRWVAARGRIEAAGSGNVMHMRGVVRDISAGRRAQDESQELRRELAHVGRVSMLGQLSTAMAHELSQPLGAILRNTEAAELLLRAPAPDLGELREIIGDIQRDDRRAGAVIDRLRAMLKRRQADLQPVAVDGLLQDVAALAGADAASRHVALECRIDPGLPPVSGDRVQLSQVLLNLVLNGMDAVADRPAMQRHVVLRGRHDGNGQVELSVTDSGHGIPRESVNRIFEPFYTTKANGMGMGLAISRTIVEAHGGRLAASNCAEGGAEFCVSLPAAERLTA